MVLDLGCGNGEWCVDAAQKRPDFQVLGVDLRAPSAEVAGLQVPNCTFRGGVDFESPDLQAIKDESLDVVRCGMLAGCVSDWPLLLRRIKR